MANFLVILDQDDERRSACVSQVSDDIAPISGLTQGQCNGDGWTAVWAAAASAPIDWVSDSEGGGVIWGDALMLQASVRPPHHCADSGRQIPTRTGMAFMQRWWLIDRVC
jgi:hypothetical protein